MARISAVTSGGKDYFSDDLPVGLIDELLTAEADVIEPFIRENAKKMLSGPYSTGLSEKSLARKPPGYGKDKSRQLVLVWRGTRREFIKNGKAVRRKEKRGGCFSERIRHEEQSAATFYLGRHRPRGKICL